MSSTNTFYSLGLMPALISLGHLAPAIGAIRTVTGSYHFPAELLGLIAAITVIVDAADKYRDIEVSDRPSKWIWRIWIGSMWAIVLPCTVLVGLPTAMDIYRVFPLGMLWGIPCIPYLSTPRKLILAKPKTLLFEAKSLVVSLSMATVCAEASMNHYCRQTEFYCGDRALQRRCFLLAVLYNFIRETSCDLRDMAEDAKEGLQTLPVRLGRENTMLLMTIAGLVLDVGLTQSIAFTSAGVTVRPLQLAYSMLRVGLTIIYYWQILKYPRDNQWVWGSVCLLGLIPVQFAHAALAN